MTNPFETFSHERVISDGETTDKLFFLLSGEASVWKAGKAIASISPGDFIGEMSFMSNQFASADVNAKETIRVAYWTHDDLNKLKQKNNRIYNKFLNIVGCDLVKKLNRNNDQLVHD
jgi:CRP-like cAMP-binding protein